MSQTMTIKQYASHRNVSKTMIYKYLEDGSISDHSIIDGRPLRIDVEGADADLRRNAITRADYPEDFADDYSEDDGDDRGDMGLDLGKIEIDVPEESPGRSVIRPLLVMVIWEFSVIAERRGKFKGLSDFVINGKWMDRLLANPDIRNHTSWLSRQIDRKGYRK